MRALGLGVEPFAAVCINSKASPKGGSLALTAINGVLVQRVRLGTQRARAGRDSEERIARLTRSATSVATPHQGTPLANHFLTLQGQTLLLVHIAWPSRASAGG
jgi:hypothetical protein